MKTSIIIPCYYKHFQHIPTLLLCYQKQTVPPDEIVISLSECEKVDPESIRSIQTGSWPFLIKLLCHTSHKSAGQNRNLACAQSSGDILICQDADDLPHPQRVEIIKFFFEHFKIDHLLHRYVASGEYMPTHSLDQIESLSKYSDIGSFAGWRVTNGNPSFIRDVFRQVNWPDQNYGEDISFNHMVYEKFQYNVVIDIPLFVYRNELSSSRLQ